MDSQLRIFREVTRYQAVLSDRERAAYEIRCAIDTCRRYSLRVYLEVPRDMVEVPIPVGRARAWTVSTKAGAVAEAAEEIAEKIEAVASPVLVVGVEVQRGLLTAGVVELAERLGVPVASTFMGRGTFPDDHPQFAGVYLGPASPPGVRELVEESDCLVMLGALLSDTNMGVRLSALDPRKVVLAVSRRVEIGYHRYEDVPLDDLLDALLGAVEPRRARRRPPTAFSRRPFMRADGPAGDEPMRVAHLIGEINRSFAGQGEMPLVTDTGDCLFADWRYAEVARLWGLAAWRVATPAELRRALEEARLERQACLIEVMLERGDISETLRTFTRSVGTTPPPEHQPDERNAIA